MVHPGAGNSSGTLVNGLLAISPQIRDVGEKNRPGVIHRLDKGTSGLLLAANTNEGYQFFVDELSDRKVKRIYQALVWGVPEGPEGIIDAPIGRSSKNRKKLTRGRKVNVQGYKKAIITLKKGQNIDLTTGI